MLGKNIHVDQWH